MAGKRTRRRYPPLPVVMVSHILPTRWSKYLESRFDDDLMDFEREVIEHWIKVNKVLIPRSDMGWPDDVETVQPSQRVERNEIIAPRQTRRQEMHEKCATPEPSPGIVPEWVRHLGEVTVYRFKKDPLL